MRNLDAWLRPLIARFNMPLEFGHRNPTERAGYAQSRSGEDQ